MAELTVLSPTAHRLVIVDGIMGSGKSTTMRHIASRLRDAHLDVAEFHERFEPHPVRGTDGLNNWFKPWLDVTHEQLTARSIEKWATFVETVRGSQTISVFDGQLFHGDLTNLFLMEASRPALEAYCRAVEDRIRPLNPLLIYLYQVDVKAAIHTISAERGQEWVRYQVDWKLQTPYSMRRGFTEMHGFVSLYEDYRRLTDHLYQKLTIPKIAIENSAQEWHQYHAQIERALGLRK